LLILIIFIYSYLAAGLQQEGAEFKILRDSICSKGCPVLRCYI
jgi:hypothetical protein